MNILVSGLPAESPDTMEPSSQFDESLHSLKREKKDKKSHDMSHGELQWTLNLPIIALTSNRM